jgi:hypothetical protein
VFFQWNGTSWDFFTEYQAPNVQWVVSYWTGATLETLVRQDSAAAPAIVGQHGTTTSVGQLVRTATGYARFAHDSLTSAPTPTDISLWSAPALASGWVQKAWVLRLADIKYFMGDTAQPFNGDSQLADPTVFEYNGRTYMVYETIRQELFDVPSLSVAHWDQPLAGVTAAYGVTQ